MPSRAADPWRLRCPAGHADLRARREGPTSGLDRPHWYCATCAKYGSDPVHPVATDAKTGQEVAP